MEIDKQEFKDLKKKVDQIWDYLKGTDLKPNGAGDQIHRNKMNIAKLWVTVYGILTGIIAAILFLLKWGPSLFS